MVTQISTAENCVRILEDDGTDGYTYRYRYSYSTPMLMKP